METVELNVSGMSCGGCENSVKAAVGQVAGVETVDADHATGMVKVTSAAPVPLDSIKAAIVEAGFTVA